MSDERVERALQAGPVGEPVFVPLGPEIWQRGRRGRSRLEWRTGRVGMAELAIAAVVILALALLPTQPEQNPGVTLPSDIRSSGRLRIVVTSERPQVVDPSGSHQGFDIDVAQALAEQLGLAAQIDAVEPALIDQGGWASLWDVAIDSAPATADRATRFALANPYYWRSSAVVVEAGSTIQRVEDLDGRAICVFPGSLADQWLRSNLVLSSGTSLPPPTGTTIWDMGGRVQDGCLFEAGMSVAFVADWGYEVGDQGNDMSVAPFVPFTAGAAPAVDLRRPESKRLVGAINRALEELLADGTLRRLSERRFNGQDYTVEPDN